MSDVADGASVDEVLHDETPLGPPLAIAHRGRHPGLSGRVPDLDSFPFGDAHGLLNEDVEAAVDGRDGGVLKQVVGRRDDDRVHVGAGDQLHRAHASQAGKQVVPGLVAAPDEPCPYPVRQALSLGRRP
jgi:hypothetical protein